MTATSKLTPPEDCPPVGGVRPTFNAYAAYSREREYSREIESLLNRALFLLEMECDRREGRGENIPHIRNFIKKARMSSINNPTKEN